MPGCSRRAVHHTREGHPPTACDAVRGDGAALVDQLLVFIDRLHSCQPSADQAPHGRRLPNGKVRQRAPLGNEPDPRQILEAPAGCRQRHVAHASGRSPRSVELPPPAPIRLQVRHPEPLGNRRRNDDRLTPVMVSEATKSRSRTTAAVVRLRRCAPALTMTSAVPRARARRGVCCACIDFACSGTASQKRAGKRGGALVSSKERAAAGLCAGLPPIPHHGLPIRRHCRPDQSVRLPVHRAEPGCKLPGPA